MRIAYIWYDNVERWGVERRIAAEQPDWHLESLHEESVASFHDVIQLLKSDYDIILVHLSMRFALALRMAAFAHRENLPCKVVLFSRTMAREDAITGFFDGHIHPDRDIGSLSRRISELAVAERHVIHDLAEINRRIVEIFNSSDALKTNYRIEFKERHKHEFTLDDYQRAIDASVKPYGDDGLASPDLDIFLSYAADDHNVALELTKMLQREGLSVFMAEHSIDSGADWKEDIRQSLRRSREVLLLLTPKSKNSSWVMLEAGGAWALGKRLTPCLTYVNIQDFPEPIRSSQARGVYTAGEKKLLVAEVAQRMHT